MKFVVHICTRVLSYQLLGRPSSVPGTSTMPADSNATAASSATPSSISEPAATTTGQFLLQTLGTVCYVALDI